VSNCALVLLRSRSAVIAPVLVLTLKPFIGDLRSGHDTSILLSGRFAPVRTVATLVPRAIQFWLTFFWEMRAGKIFPREIAGRLRR
jgi:hypothetical protein